MACIVNNTFDKEGSLEKTTQSLRLAILAAALATIVLVYLPTQFYGANQKHMSFLLSDALRWLYPVAIGVVGIIAALGLLIPKSLARVLGTLLAILFLGSYLQSGILS